MADENFSQGARCGHIEGKGRAGMYVIGEADELSWEAAGNQRGLSSKERSLWAAGYRHGYKLAAQGLELESEHKL